MSPSAIDIKKILALAAKSNASDIHVKVGLPPMFRVNGKLAGLRDVERLTMEDSEAVARQVMDDHQFALFKEKRELDLAYSLAGSGRFRVSAFHQRGSVGLVFRTIPVTIPSLDDMQLPQVLKQIAEEQRGMILVTGTTGSGKSTTMAALVDHINSTRTCHIMTIEDPIEFIIRDKRSIINQKEVGIDTLSFKNSLRAALRQDPDVIFVGEMRDYETMDLALAAAETGHLVLSTLHTLDAPETINRIVSTFASDKQDGVRLQLAQVLKAVISQRLIPRTDVKGRAPAVEVMRITARIKELIVAGKLDSIRDAIAEGFSNYGMQTFDQSLMQLVRDGKVTFDLAMKYATNPDDFKLRFEGVQSTATNENWGDFERTASGTHSAMTHQPTKQNRPSVEIKPEKQDEPSVIERTSSGTHSAMEHRPSKPNLKSVEVSNESAGKDDDFEIEHF